MPTEQIDGDPARRYQENRHQALRATCPSTRRASTRLGLTPTPWSRSRTSRRPPSSPSRTCATTTPTSSLPSRSRRSRRSTMSSGTTGVATVGGYTQHDLDIWGECFGRGIEYANGGPDDIVPRVLRLRPVHRRPGRPLRQPGYASAATVIPMSAGNDQAPDSACMRDFGSTVHLLYAASYAMHHRMTRAIEIGHEPAKELPPARSASSAPSRSPRKCRARARATSSAITAHEHLRPDRDHGPGRFPVECRRADTACTSGRGPLPTPRSSTPSPARILPEGEWGELVHHHR